MFIRRKNWNLENIIRYRIVQGERVEDIIQDLHDTVMKEYEEWKKSKENGGEDQGT